MGSRYSNYLGNVICDKSQIYVVDNNPNIIKNLRKEGFHSFSSLSQLPNNEKFDYGIVANWGPDHLSTAEMLIKLGCKRLIIEKPISNSLSELVDFRNKFEDKDIFVTVHHFFRFTNFLDTFRKAEKKYNFGEPVGIRLSGGAVLRVLRNTLS